MYRVIGCQGNSQCITWTSKLLVREGGANVACQRFNGAVPLRCFALYLLGTEISSVDEAWLVKRKELTLYWLIYTWALHNLIPRHLLEKSHFSIKHLRTRVEHYSWGSRDTLTRGCSVLIHVLSWMVRVSLVCKAGWCGLHIPFLSWDSQSISGVIARYGTNPYYILEISMPFDGITGHPFVFTFIHDENVQLPPGHKYLY